MFENKWKNSKYLSRVIFSDCTKAAVEEFPDDFLTAEQRKNGGVIIHFIIGKVCPNGKSKFTRLSEI